MKRKKLLRSLCMKYLEHVSGYEGRKRDAILWVSEKEPKVYALFEEVVKLAYPKEK